MRWVLIFLVVMGALAGYLTRQTLDARQQLLDDHLIEAHATWDAVTHVYRLVSESIVAESVDRPEVWSIMRQALGGDAATRDRARERLFRLMSPVYDRLKQRNLRQLHFHLPDATSFLRMHLPERYGDSLAEARPTVMIANQQMRAVSAFETGKVYHGFRFVFPLMDGPTHLGSVEASVAFSVLGHEMETLRPGLTFQFILSASSVRITQPDVWTFGLGRAVPVFP